MSSVKGGGTSIDDTFLKNMANHHVGIIAMARDATQRGGKEVRADAKMMMKKQQAELEHILDKLRSDYGTEHTPEVDATSEQMLRELESDAGAEYDRHFRRMTVQHHQEGVRMIEQHVTRLSEPLQVMVRRMSAEQMAEVEEQEQKMRMGM